MNVRISTALALLLSIGLLLAACGGGTTPPPLAATNTPLPPAPAEVRREASAPPTATPVPPTETPVPTATGGGAVQALAAEEVQPAATAQPSNAGTFDAATAFKSKCSFCHGPDGSGGVSNPNSVDGVIPALNTAEFAQEFDTAAKIKTMILDGSEPAKAAEAPGAPINMPGFKSQLSEAELDALVAYIRGLSEQ
jgi:mono/diheme cytochrome c family protein